MQSKGLPPVRPRFDWLANLVALFILLPHLICGYLPVYVHLLATDFDKASGWRHRLSAILSKLGIEKAAIRSFNTLSDYISNPANTILSYWRRLRAFILSGGGGSTDDCNALGVTLTRYCFAGHADPLNIDPEEAIYAKLFLPAWARVVGDLIRWVGPLRVFDTCFLRGMFPYIGRVKIIDDAFTTHAEGNKSLGIPRCQIIILGAGYDTRAYRRHKALMGPVKDWASMPSPSASSDVDLPRVVRAQVLEIDQIQVQKRKCEILEKGLGRSAYRSITQRVQYIPCTFGDDDQLLSALRSAADISPHKSTFVIMEGVSAYLNPKVFRRIIRTLQTFFFESRDRNGEIVPTPASSDFYIFFDTLTTDTIEAIKKKNAFSWDRVTLTYGLGDAETTLSSDQKVLRRELGDMGMTLIKQYLWNDLLSQPFIEDCFVAQILHHQLQTQLPFLLEERPSMIQFLYCKIDPSPASLTDPVTTALLG